MAKKSKTKKKTNSNSNYRRGVRKTSVTPRKRKTNKDVQVDVTKEEVTSKVIKDFVILVTVLLLIFGLVYLLTLAAGKLGWFDQGYTAPTVEEANISYESIEAGTMFNRSEENYYVVLGDFSNNNMYVDALIDSYSDKENSLKVYKVDLSNGMNSFLKGEESNTSSSNVNKLSINDFTLIEVRNNNNVNSYVGTEQIANILK